MFNFYYSPWNILTQKPRGMQFSDEKGLDFDVPTGVAAGFSFFPLSDNVFLFLMKTPLTQPVPTAYNDQCRYNGKWKGYISWSNTSGHFCRGKFPRRKQCRTVMTGIGNCFHYDCGVQFSWIKYVCKGNVTVHKRFLQRVCHIFVPDFIPFFSLDKINKKKLLPRSCLIIRLIVVRGTFSFREIARSGQGSGRLTKFFTFKMVLAERAGCKRRLPSLFTCFIVPFLSNVISRIILLTPRFDEHNPSKDNLSEIFWPDNPFLMMNPNGCSHISTNYTRHHQLIQVKWRKFSRNCLKWSFNMCDDVSSHWARGGEKKQSCWSGTKMWHTIWINGIMQSKKPESF